MGCVHPLPESPEACFSVVHTYTHSLLVSLQNVSAQHTTKQTLPANRTQPSTHRCAATQDGTAVVSLTITTRQAWRTQDGMLSQCRPSAPAQSPRISCATRVRRHSHQIFSMSVSRLRKGGPSLSSSQASLHSTAGCASITAFSVQHPWHLSGTACGKQTTSRQGRWQSEAHQSKIQLQSRTHGALLLAAAGQSQTYRNPKRRKHPAQQQLWLSRKRARGTAWRKCAQAAGGPQAEGACVGTQGGVVRNQCNASTNQGQPRRADPAPAHPVGMAYAGRSEGGGGWVIRHTAALPRAMQHETSACRKQLLHNIRMRGGSRSASLCVRMLTAPQACIGHTQHAGAPGRSQVETCVMAKSTAHQSRYTHPARPPAAVCG